jgi:MoxR-like ATPase
MRSISDCSNERGGRDGAAQFQLGPVLTNVRLADEINRTIPRTQSSLPERMEERQITIDGQTMPLPAPFFVIATHGAIFSSPPTLNSY